MYILKNRQPIEVSNMEAWAQWTNDMNQEPVGTGRIVAGTVVGKVMVSTVFTGIDTFNRALPLLFETMIFGGEHDGYVKRHATWEQAEEGHKVAVSLISN